MNPALAMTVAICMAAACAGCSRFVDPQDGNEHSDSVGVPADSARDHALGSEKDEQRVSPLTRGRDAAAASFRTNSESQPAASAANVVSVADARQIRAFDFLDDAGKSNRIVLGKETVAAIVRILSRESHEVDNKWFEASLPLGEFAAEDGRTALELHPFCLVQPSPGKTSTVWKSKEINDLTEVFLGGAVTHDVVDRALKAIGRLKAG